MGGVLEGGVEKMRLKEKVRFSRLIDQILNLNTETMKPINNTSSKCDTYTTLFARLMNFKFKI